MDIKDFCVDRKTTIKESMRKIDKNAFGIAFILNTDESLFGVVTDGDIRRVLLKGISIEEQVEKIANINPVVFQESITKDEIPAFLEKKGLIYRLINIKIPVINAQRKIIDIIFVFFEKNRIFFNSIFEDKGSTRITHSPVKTVLIIGGAGYLGSVLCRKLLNEGYNVKVLDNLTYGEHGIQELLSEKNFHLIKGDIRSIESVMDSISNIDAVIHLAALVGDPASAINPQKTLEINYHSTKMIAEICKYYQINRFAFASTCSVYGKSLSENDFLTENSKLNPLSLYAKTKIESEKALKISSDENFAPTIFRMATIYGLSPRMRFDLVVNLLTAKAYFEKKIYIFGGEQQRPIIHVEDVADAYLKYLKAPLEKVKGKVFNLGSNEQNYKIIEIAQKIQEFIPGTSIEIDNSSPDVRDYIVDFTRIKATLDFTPKRTIEYCLNELKNEFKKDNYKDYLDSKYNNFEYLQDKL